MSDTIYKYVILPEATTVNMPRSAKPLSVAVQAGCVCIWAEVSTLESMAPRRVWAVPTGGAAPPKPWEAEFLGTVHLHEGRIVLHVYLEHCPR